MGIYASMSIKNCRKRHLNVKIVHLMRVDTFFFFLGRETLIFILYNSVFGFGLVLF